MEVEELLLNTLGVNPIEKMAKLADDPSTPVEVRARLFAELAQYVAPKRKSVEINAQVDAVARQVQWPEDERPTSPATDPDQIDSD